MPRLSILIKIEINKFDSTPKLNQRQREKFFAINSAVEEYLACIKKNINRVGFLIQLAYFRASGKFFPNSCFRIEDITFACSALNIEPMNLNLSATNYLPRDKTIHKKIILKYLNWQAFDKIALEKLKQELLLHAKQQLRPKILFSIATQFLLNNNIELPQYYVIADLITTAYNEVENVLIKIIEQMLTAYQKEILDDIICIDDKGNKHYKYSCLAKIKQMSQSTKIVNILDSIETFKLIKEFYNNFAKVYAALELSEHACQYYAI